MIEKKFIKLRRKPQLFGKNQLDGEKKKKKPKACFNDAK